MRRIYTILLAIASFAALTTVYAAPAAFAETSVLGDACNKGNNNSVICKQSSGAEGKTKKFVADLTNLLLFAIGVITIIMIIIGGIRYTTSNGDSSQISSAKNTILYAVIGLVIAFMAYGIVNYVVNEFS